MKAHSCRCACCQLNHLKVPTQSLSLRACRLLHEELKAAGSSAHLAGLVGSTVGKALRMMAEKAEYMAAAGPELRQVRPDQRWGGGWGNKPYTACSVYMRSCMLFLIIQPCTHVRHPL